MHRKKQKNWNFKILIIGIVHEKDLTTYAVRGEIKVFKNIMINVLSLPSIVVVCTSSFSPHIICLKI